MEKEKLLKLDITDDERAKISEHARYTKSSNININNLYEKDELKKLRIIREAYILFFDLSNNYGISESVQNKIKLYIKQFEEIDKKVQNFLSEDFEIEYGRDKVLNNIDNFLMENDELFNNLIYESFLIGRTVKKYNPEESTGYY
jgi:hypothetical protein